MLSSIQRKKLAQQRIGIINQLSDLSRNGWANAKACDYEPLERELRTMTKQPAMELPLPKPDSFLLSLVLAKPLRLRLLA